MASIHPKPQLKYIRNDGAGGLELVIKMPDGRMIVDAIAPVEEARWLKQISTHIEEQFRKAFVRAA